MKYIPSVVVTGNSNHKSVLHNKGKSLKFNLQYTHKTSVADPDPNPDPDPPDPRVFGPPGSGSFIIMKK
jgi:hypothetical protein